MLARTVTGLTALMLIVAPGTRPAFADSPTPPPGQLECAEYYVVAEFAFADLPAATEYTDLLTGLNWGVKIISAAPQADAAAAGKLVIQIMKQNAPALAMPFGAQQDYASRVQPLIDHYDAPCRGLSGLPPLDINGLQAAIEARLKAKGIKFQ